MLTGRQIQNLLIKFEHMELSTRSKNGLEWNRIVHVAEYLVLNKDRLSRLHKLGETSREEIEFKISELGFRPGFLLRYKNELEDGLSNIRSKYGDMPPERRKSLIDSEVTDKIISVLQNASLTLSEEQENSASAEIGQRHWFIQKLPPALRKGLKSQFVDSIINDPKVVKEVQDVLIAAVKSKLGLDEPS